MSVAVARSRGSGEEFASWLDRAEQLQVFPRTAHDLLAHTRDEGGANADLVTIIGRDPVLASHLLRVANSPFYGRPGGVSTLEQAVRVLGYVSARHLALSLALAQGLTRLGERGAALHRHARQVARVADLLGRRKGWRIGPLAHVAGLLHDIGRVVFLAVDPDACHRFAATGRWPTTAEERAVFGVAHTDLGAACLARWRISDDICTAAQYHHSPLPRRRPGIAPDTATRLLIAITLADVLEPAVAARDEATVAHLLERHEASLVAGLTPDAHPDLPAALVALADP